MLDRHAAFWYGYHSVSYIDTIFTYVRNSALWLAENNRVWRNGYAAVYHLGNGSSVNALIHGMNNGTVLGVMLARRSGAASLARIQPPTFDSIEQ